MFPIIKIVGQEANVTTIAGNSFSNATCLKVVNMGANAILSVYDSTTLIGNTTLLAGSVTIFQKYPTHTVNATTNTMLATPIAKV